MWLVRSSCMLLALAFLSVPSWAAAMEPPTSSIPERDVIAGAAISDSGDSKIPRVFVSSTQALSHEGRIEEARVVEIPENMALLGIALSNNGIPVEANDMMNIAARGGSSMDDISQHAFVKEDVLFALLFGLEVEPGS